MTYATASLVQHSGHHGQHLHHGAGQSCRSCNDHLEPEAKFCGSCGFIVVPDSFNISQLRQRAQLMLEAMEEESETVANTPVQVTPAAAIPQFALPVTAAPSKKVVELNEEARRLMLHLARGRVFLYFYIALFLAINIFGCWVAWTCYTQYIGDEMTKTVMASTPFLFINLVALVVMSPIKSTKAEIARLKEKLSHNRFQIEYGHLKF